MANTLNEQNVGEDEGPTEKMRDDEKTESGVVVPGAQKPDNKDIKDEKGLNTE